jgi:hypothetical protein
MFPGSRAADGLYSGSLEFPPQGHRGDSQFGCRFLPVSPVFLQHIQEGLPLGRDLGDVVKAPVKTGMV